MTRLASRDGGGRHIAWPSSFPELVTERLRLRAPLPRDAEALLRILGDPEVTRHLNVSTIATRAEAHAMLERLEQRYAARDTIRWAIELVGHGDMIGTVGLLRFDFEHGHAEVGYEIARQWWGRGLTPEAVAAVVGYGFSVMGLHRVEAGILPGNDASVRVVQKLGFLEEGRGATTFTSTGVSTVSGGSACSRQTCDLAPDRIAVGRDSSTTTTKPPEPLLWAALPRSALLRTTYKNYTIVAEAMKRPDAGWTARVTIYNTSSVLVMGPLELGQAVIFATLELAEQAAVLLGRAWVDHPETPSS